MPHNPGEPIPLRRAADTPAETGEKDGKRRQPTITVVPPDDLPALPTPAATALLRLLRAVRHRRATTTQASHTPAFLPTDGDETERRAA
jgi:hypothetical protein